MNLFAQTPQNWTKASIGKYCDVQLGKMLQNDPSSERDELKPYLRAINIGKGGLDLSHDFSMWIRPQEAERFRLTKGDILVSEGGDAGRAVTFDADDEYYFQNAINRVRPNHHGMIVPEFIYYWFTFLKVAGYVEMICNVATIPHFTAEKVKAAPLVVPPLDTQRRIARFLDEKTARIDGLIEKKRMLLDRLAEKRQALVTRAVTKGLNPDAPMKPSGIDWLGAIPVHWELRRLKFGTTKIGSGVTPRGGASVYVNSGIMLLRSQNVHFEGLDLDDVVFIDDDIDNEMSETRVFFGDVLLNITGASIGRCCLFDQVNTRANVNQHVCIIRPADIVADFVAMLLASSVGQLQIYLSQNGASREGLNFGDLGNFIVPTPPVSEQANITQTMQFQIDTIGEQSLRVLQSIGILEEYRSAVITAAVTGQIEVLF